MIVDISAEQLLLIRIFAVLAFAIIWKAILDGVDFWLSERRQRNRRHDSK